MPDINLADAARFLQLLDPTATKFEFRTFDDNKSRKDKNLTRTFYGMLTEHSAKLIRRSATNMAFATRQKILDPIPLIVA